MDSIWVTLAEHPEDHHEQVHAMKMLATIFLKMGYDVRCVGWHEESKVVEMHCGDE